MTHLAATIINQNVKKHYYRRVFDPIINLAREVYNDLSWGWHESVYREAFASELLNHGYLCSQEIVKPIFYKGKELSHVNARLDLLIEKGTIKMIIELKADGATRHTMIKAEQQCKRYLALTGISYGMVINFPERELREIEFVPIYYKNSTYFGVDWTNQNDSYSIDKEEKNNNETVAYKIEKKKSGVRNYIYNKNNRERVKTEDPNIKGTQITGYLSREWKSLDEKRKAKWNI